MKKTISLLLFLFLISSFAGCEIIDSMTDALGITEEEDEDDKKIEYNYFFDWYGFGTSTYNNTLFKGSPYYGTSKMTITEQYEDYEYDSYNQTYDYFTVNATSVMEYDDKGRQTDVTYSEEKDGYDDYKEVTEITYDDSAKTATAIVKEDNEIVAKSKLELNDKFQVVAETIYITEDAGENYIKYIEFTYEFNSNYRITNIKATFYRTYDSSRSSRVLKSSIRQMECLEKQQKNKLVQRLSQSLNKNTNAARDIGDVSATWNDTWEYVEDKLPLKYSSVTEYIYSDGEKETSNFRKVFTNDGSKIIKVEAYSSSGDDSEEEKEYEQTFDYDENGNVISFSETDDPESDYADSYKTEYELNDGGLIISEITSSKYYDENQYYLVDKNTYEYDSKDRIIKEQDYDVAEEDESFEINSDTYIKYEYE